MTQSRAIDTLLRSLDRLALVGRHLLILSVCVTLCQLPVPMMHHHERFASSEAWSSHLARHHDDGQNRHCENQESDHASIHWHFVLPSELGHEHQSDSESSSTPTCVINGQQGASGFGFAIRMERLSLNIVLLDRCDRFTDRPIFKRTTHSPDFQLPKSRLCARFNVMQC